MNYFILNVFIFSIQDNTKPLDMARYGHHTETASLLKECGGDPSIDTKVIYMRLYIYKSDYYVLLYMLSL